MKHYLTIDDFRKKIVSLPDEDFVSWGCYNDGFFAHKKQV